MNHYDFTPHIIGKPAHVPSLSWKLKTGEWSHRFTVIGVTTVYGNTPPHCRITLLDGNGNQVIVEPEAIDYVGEWEPIPKEYGDVDYP